VQSLQYQLTQLKVTVPYSMMALSGVGERIIMENLGMGPPIFPIPLSGLKNFQLLQASHRAPSTTVRFEWIRPSIVGDTTPMESWEMGRTNIRSFPRG